MTKSIIHAKGVDDHERQHDESVTHETRHKT